MPLPLEGIRVLDWTVFQQGPVATAMLGDLGADVIKIEERVSGDPARGTMRVVGAMFHMAGHNFYWENNNRNKRGIALDLKKPQGREIAHRLVQRSDVFVQNFRHGVAVRLGLDYDTLSHLNPRLIYASANGFGSQGPDADEPAFDPLAQARSGIMTTVGDPDMPPLRINGAIADGAAAIMLAYAIMTALLVRERFGIGQEVESSLLGSMIALQSINVAASTIVGEDFPRRSRTQVGNPLYNHYRCGDGKWLCLGMMHPDRFWGHFSHAVGLGELEKDPRFATSEAMSQHGEELVAILDRLFASRPRAEWLKLLDEKGDFNFAPVNEVDDLVHDPQVLANDYITDFTHPSWGPIKVVGIPVKFSRTPGSLRRAAPEFGQHTEEVLLEIGYSWEEIDRLRAEEVL